MRTYATAMRIPAATCAVLALAVVPAGAAGPAKDPAFADARNYGVEREPSDVIAADLDAVGDPDLATTNQGSPDGTTFTVPVLRNEGDGKFGVPVDHGVGRFPTSVVAADLGGTEKPELAVANLGPSTVSVLINTTGKHQ